MQRMRRTMRRRRGSAGEHASGEMTVVVRVCVIVTDPEARADQTERVVSDGWCASAVQVYRMRWRTDILLVSLKRLCSLVGRPVAI